MTQAVPAASSTTHAAKPARGNPKADAGLALLQAALAPVKPGRWEKLRVVLEGAARAVEAILERYLDGKVDPLLGSSTGSLLWSRVFDKFKHGMDDNAILVSELLVTLTFLSSLCGLPKQGCDVTVQLLLMLLSLSSMLAFASMCCQARLLFGNDGLCPIAREGKATLAAALTVASEQGFQGRQALLRGLEWLITAMPEPEMNLPRIGLTFAILTFLLELLPWRWQSSLLLNLSLSTLLLMQYVFYQALYQTGGHFTSLQFDSLLIEALLWATLLALARPSVVGQMAGVAVFRMMATKLMWLSGLCKLKTGDVRWHMATAMDVHFLTQPLPNPYAKEVHWSMNKAPAFSRCCSAASILGELAFPFLAVLGLQAARAVSFLSLLVLLLAMAATGNYGTFHILSVTTLTAYIGDDLLPVTAPAMARDSLLAPALAFAALLGCTCYFFASISVLVEGWVEEIDDGMLGRRFARGLASLGGCSSYGLFGQVCERRHEIVIFESHVAEAAGQVAELWELGFKYKPGPLNRPPPRLLTLHMPRLDWMLWFASLRMSCAQSLQLQREHGLGPDAAAPPWLMPLLAKLEARDPVVMDMFDMEPHLLSKKPLATQVAVYEYTFNGCESFNGMYHPDFPYAGPWEVGQWWSRRHLMDVPCPQGAVQ